MLVVNFGVTAKYDDVCTVCGVPECGNDMHILSHWLENLESILGRNVAISVGHYRIRVAIYHPKYREAQCHNERDRRHYADARLRRLFHFFHPQMGTRVFLVEAAGRERSHPNVRPCGFAASPKGGLRARIVGLALVGGLGWLLYFSLLGSLGTRLLGFLCLFFEDLICSSLQHPVPPSWPWETRIDKCCLFQKRRLACGRPSCMVTERRSARR